MHVAAQLTQAACGGAGGNLPVSPDLADPAVRAKNLHTWETFRVFYRAVQAALADNQSWPSAKLDLAGLIGNFVPLLTSGPLADIVSKVIKLLPAPVPAGPIPDPGK
jgi:hypothetical protein